MVSSQRSRQILIEPTQVDRLTLLRPIVTHVLQNRFWQAPLTNTRSGVTTVFLGCARIAALRATWILAILNSREACTSAVFALYPARIAACFPLRSTRYSSTNRDCFGVSMTDQVGLISAWRDIFYSGSATVVGPRISCVLTETV